MPIIDPYDGSEIDITTGNVTIIDPFDGKPIKIKTNSPKSENYKYSGPSEKSSLVAAPASDYTWAKRAARKIAPATGNILRTGGQILGGLAGLAAAPFTGPAAPAMPVAGGVAGYTGGDYLQYKLEEFGGTQPRRTIPEAAWDTTKAAGEGLLYEGLGVAARAAIPLAVKGAKTMAGMGESTSWAERGAANKLKDLVGEKGLDPYEKNIAKVKELKGRVKGFKPNLGQTTKNPNVIQETQARVRANNSAAETYKEAEAINNAALRDYVDESIPGVQDDYIDALNYKKIATETGYDESQKALTSKDPYSTGEKIIGEIDKAKEPIERVMNDLESQIPKYPMSFDNTNTMIEQIIANPKASNRYEKRAALMVKKELEKHLENGPSTHTAMGLRRDINGLISEAEDGQTQAALLKIKNSLDADVAEVSGKARTGKLATYNGNVIDPDRLANEYENNLLRISKINTNQVYDVESMSESLKQKGIPILKQRGEDTASFTKRILNDYKRIISEDIPTLSTQENIQPLLKRNEEIKTILSNVSPGQDVAAAMNAYNKYASNEFFRRFDTPTMSRATAKGINTENIPSYFKTETGSLDLIKAIGKDKAKEILSESFNHDLSSIPNLTSKNLDKWLRDNNASLTRLGLKDQYKDIATATHSLESFNKTAASKMIGADPDKIFKASLTGNTLSQDAKEMFEMVKDNPAALKGLQKSFADHIVSASETTKRDLAGSLIMTPGKAEQVYKKYGSAMKEIFKDSPEKLQTMADVKDIIEILSRDAAPIFSGSPTAGWWKRIAEETGDKVIPLHLKYTVKLLKTYKTGQIDKYFERALFDPDYAQTLLDSVKGKTTPEETEKAIRTQMRMISRSIITAKREQQKQREDLNNESN